MKNEGKCTLLYEAPYSATVLLLSDVCMHIEEGGFLESLLQRRKGELFQVESAPRNPFLF